MQYAEGKRSRQQKKQDLNIKISFEIVFQNYPLLTKRRKHTSEIWIYQGA